MYIIADGLARLLAPILPVTIEELWKHLPGARERSVHMAEFPRDVDGMRDPALVARWKELLAARDEVNRVLETARQGRTIGNSLGAKVRLRARGATADLLERYRTDLPMLFIVSQLELEREAGDGPALEVEVHRAAGEKCARCWRIVPSISSAPGSEGLCERCVDALNRADLLAG
jgi:isoleucyl-tRNA synthetase